MAHYRNRDPNWHSTKTGILTGRYGTVVSPGKGALAVLTAINHKLNITQQTPKKTTGDWETQTYNYCVRK